MGSLSAYVTRKESLSVRQLVLPQHPVFCHGTANIHHRRHKRFLPQLPTLLPRTHANLSAGSAQHPESSTIAGTLERSTLVQHDSTSGTHTPQDAKARCKAIVDEVLQLIQGTDGGLTMSSEAKAQVDRLLNELEVLGDSQQPRPLKNPWLFGNYCVAYTSSGSSQRGNPAGGRFRGSVGRALFKTTGVYQSVLQADVATNKVSFKLFGCIPGAVGLRGKILPEGQGQDTVRVLFDPPVLSLGTNFHLRIGPPSSVVLKTTYLDDRVRIGKGSRGSLFVFTRGGEAESAGMNLVGTQSSTPAAMATFTAAFTGWMVGALALWLQERLWAKGVAIMMWAVGALIASVVRQGGIIPDNQMQMWRQQQLKISQQVSSGRA